MPKRKLPKKDIVKNKPASQVSKEAPLSDEKGNGDLTEEEKLQKELRWCIDQLHLGLMTQKAGSKQTQETIRIIKTLASSTAPLVKKRQIMRQTFGDYRKKMADEEAKWLKDVERLRKVSNIRPIYAPKNSTYIRTSSGPNSVSLSEIFSRCSIEESSDEANGKQKTDVEHNPEQFKFNFSIPEE